jgi:hypothetical protein
MKRGFAAQFGERLKFLSPQQATGYFGNFTTAHRAVVTHFRFKKDFILYLNSSRAASSGELESKSLQTKAGFLSLNVFLPFTCRSETKIPPSGNPWTLESLNP